MKKDILCDICPSHIRNNYHNDGYAIVGNHFRPKTTMLKYERAILSEKELEDRIINNPDLIEDGLRYLEHQRQTTTGRFDILFVDNNDSLVVSELKVVECKNRSE